MLPTVSNMPAPLPAVLPALPKSWSELSWRQLCAVWQCKLRYGGNADVARAAALLALLGLEAAVETESRNNGITALCYDERTGEAVYTLRDGDGRLWAVTPRELSQLARQTMKWFDFPYGDPGKEAVRDEKGKVVEEAVEPVRGYVNPEWRDAMQLPEETLVVCGDRMLTGTEWQAMTDKERDAVVMSEFNRLADEEKERLLGRDWKKMKLEERKQILHSSLFAHHFKLPEVTIRNLTWQQYRTLQFIVPELFREGASDDDILSLQAQFVAHTLVPSKDTPGGDAFSPKQEYKYDSDRAEQTVAFWRERLAAIVPDGSPSGTAVLYCLCFQTYQTAMHYYEQVFPLLFSGGGKSDPLQDALTGEVGTINAVMKYQGYQKPEDVYAENLPVILSTLNTMAKEAKDIEAMNARIKHKR